MSAEKRELNFQTINVFNFISRSNILKGIAKDFDTYKSFTDYVLPLGVICTDSEVSLSDEDLDYDFLDEFIRCFK